MHRSHNAPHIRGKLVVFTAALVSLLIAGAALAKTVAVTITTNGYVPEAVTIATGDSVQFTNSDTVAHQIVFRSTTGVTCAPASLVLQPTQSATCTFRAAGRFTYSDPNVRGNRFRGTVTVDSAPAPPGGPALSLAAKPRLVVYGGTATLTGALSNQKTGESVDVLAKRCGQPTAARVTTVQTTNGGAFSALVRPLKNTVYTVKVKNTTSPSVAVNVRPRLRLRKVADQRYSLRAFAARSFAGKYGTFQRYNGALRRWVTVKRVLFRASRAGVAPTVISSATFRSAVRPGLRVRTVLPQLQVGSCHRPGRSNVVLS
jgi:plastocyanin